MELRPRYVNIQQGAFKDIPFTESFVPKLKGLRSNYELRTRLVLSYDTHDSVSIPRRGSWVTLFGGIADRSLLSSVSCSVFGLEGRHDYPIGQRFTLAGHIAARYMSVGKRTPFWALSQLGGDRSDLGGRQPLRGYGDSRFIDNNLLIANLELRTHVFSLEVFGTRATLELTLFVEVGRVFHGLTNNSFKNLHPVGVRTPRD